MNILLRKHHCMLYEYNETFDCVYSQGSLWADLYPCWLTLQKPTTNLGPAFDYWSPLPEHPQWIPCRRDLDPAVGLIIIAVIFEPHLRLTQQILGRHGRLKNKAPPLTAGFGCRPPIYKVLLLPRKKSLTQSPQVA